MTGREYTLRRLQRLPLPIERTFAFFADAGNLEAITPPFLKFRIVSPVPIEMRAGALIEYRLQLFGIPFGWRTEIEAFDAPRRFVDRQISGPYALWHHTHEFRSLADPETGALSTEMIDTVRYAIRPALLGPIAERLFVRRTLERIFDYRAKKIVELI
ncbi:MAG: SRPBCC family protein [Planctomycetia bacterium]|nr:SRPBCC family protein [Planctomycetia bacterium]